MMVCIYHGTLPDVATMSFPQLSACSNKPIIEFFYLAQGLYSVEAFKIIFSLLEI